MVLGDKLATLKVFFQRRLVRLHKVATIGVNQAYRGTMTRRIDGGEWLGATFTHSRQPLAFLMPSLRLYAL